MGVFFPYCVFFFHHRGCLFIIVGISFYIPYKVIFKGPVRGDVNILGARRGF